jgi:hypothetical protein
MAPALLPTVQTGATARVAWVEATLLPLAPAGHDDKPMVLAGAASPNVLPKMVGMALYVLEKQQELLIRLPAAAAPLSPAPLSRRGPTAPQLSPPWPKNMQVG